MKTMKILGNGFVAAMSLALAGCGGSNGTPATPNPYVNGQYNNQQVNTPYTCQAGMIQLRNAFGQNQCFQTSVLSDACSQIGGLMVGAQCRKERLIAGSSIGKFRNNGAMAPDNIPLRVNLFAGEGVKIYGKVDSLNSNVVLWNAQLIQNGMALGSASGDTNRSADLANLSITSISTANSQLYMQPGVNQYQNPYQNQYQPTQYPNSNGLYAAGFYNQPATATPNQLILQIMFQGKVRVELHASAISCEDGHGNSYPCQ